MLIGLFFALVLVAPLDLALAARVSEAPQIERSRNGIKYTLEAQVDRVGYLPGWGELETFDMFSGYITVDKKAGRALFYVLVTSENSAIDDPLILWLNGGPGCSSLGGGFLSELGPFLPQENGVTLKANPYPWNKVASVLFLESPAFVGWSYSNTSGDRIVGDARTAADSRQFLLGFMQRFPHFQKNDLYLAGESYAGHYVPNLAREIVRGNRGASRQSEILPLRGILVGNPLTDTATDNIGAIDFWWHHAMISDEALQGIKDNCDFTRVGPLRASQARVQEPTKDNDELCDDFINRASDELGPLNIYEIYADVCLPRQSRHETEAFALALGSSPGGFAARIASRMHKAIQSHRALSLGRGASGLSEEQYDPCVDDEVETWMNLPEVQRALHANQTVVLPWRWTDCTSQVVYSREDLLATMIPVYQELLESEDLRILVFSGDVDGILPVVGTRRWVAGLGLRTLKPWRPYTSETGQLAGHVIEYDKRLMFATVRNAGHMVPYVQPERMMYLLKSFLNKSAP